MNAREQLFRAWARKDLLDMSHERLSDPVRLLGEIARSDPHVKAIWIDEVRRVHQRDRAGLVRMLEYLRLYGLTQRNGPLVETSDALLRAAGVDPVSGERVVAAAPPRGRRKN